MSAGARKMIVRRHISYIILNVLCQVYNMVSKVTNNVDWEKNYSGPVLTIFAVLFFGQGVWLNLVRIAEPTYVPTVAFYTKRLFCR